MWKENELDLLALCPSMYMNETLNAILHTLLFTRAPGPIKPSTSNVIKPSTSLKSVCPELSSLKYAHCGKVPSVNVAVQKAIENVITSQRRSFQSGMLLVSFFERKVRPSAAANASSDKSWSIGRTMMLLSGTGPLPEEQKIYWEQWVLPLTFVTEEGVDRYSQVHQTIQHGIKQVVTMVQDLENIPSSMYEFEIHYVRNMKEKDALYRSMLPR